MSPEWDAHLRRIAAEAAASMRREPDFGTGDTADGERLVADIYDRMAGDAAFARAVYAAVLGLCMVDAVYCEHVATSAGEHHIVHLIREVREEQALLKAMPTEGKVH